MAAIALATIAYLGFCLLAKPFTPSQKQVVLRSFLELVRQDLSPIRRDITTHPVTARGVIGIDDEGTWYKSRLDSASSHSGRHPSPTKDHLTQLQEIRRSLRGVAGEVFYMDDYPNLRFTIINEKTAFPLMDLQRPRENECVCIVESKSRP